VVEEEKTKLFYPIIPLTLSVVFGLEVCVFLIRVINQYSLFIVFPIRVINQQQLVLIKQWKGSWF